MSLEDRTTALLSDSERMRVYPVMLATIPLAVWVVDVASGHGLVDRGGHVVGADFTAFYTAGAFVREGRVADLGSALAQSEFQRALVLPDSVDGFTQWVNPPFLAYAFAPLAALSYPVALAFFSLLGVATFVSTVLFVRRVLHLAPSPGRLLVLAVSYFPTVAWFTFGQTSAFSLAVMTGVVAALLARRDLLAGLLLGGLAYKPQLAVGVGLALVFARRWRAVSGTLASGSGFLALSLALAPAATRSWLVSSPGLLAFIRQSGYRTWGLSSLYGASALLLDGVSPRLAGAVGAALTLAAIAFVAVLWNRVPWRPEQLSFRLALASTLAVALLVSPHLYFYDLMLMLLPAALALAALASAETVSGPILAATAWVYVLSLPSPYLALAQQAATRHLTGHACALQIETVAIALWAWRVGRRAIAEALPPG